MVETGERFYLMHDGTSMTVRGGRAGRYDLDVPITEAQVDAVARLAADGTLDETDAYAIMRVLFNPISRSFLTGNFLTNPVILQMAGVEDLIHITFWTEGRLESSSLTLKAEGLHWSVIDGLEGRPKRVFRLNPGESLEYMQHVFVTRKSMNPQVWIAFVDWYKQWRERVSFVPTA